MLLTESDIVHLTGYTQTAAQSRWLNKEGMAHKINARGEIVITWEVVNRALQFVDVSSDSGTCVRFVVPNRVYLSPFLAAFGTGYSQRRAA